MERWYKARREGERGATSLSERIGWTAQVSGLKFWRAPYHGHFFRVEILKFTGIGVGRIARRIPLWSLYNYTIIPPQNPVLIIKAPVLPLHFKI